MYMRSIAFPRSAALVMALALSGCQVAPQIPDSILSVGPDGATSTNSIIARHSSQAASALRDLAETDIAVARRGLVPVAPVVTQAPAAEVAAAPAPAPKATEPVVPPGYEPLMKRVNFRFTGDIEDIVRRSVSHIPASADWRYVAPQRRPMMPLMVTIHAQHTTILDVLRDAGAQAGLSAEIKVDPQSRTVALTYASKQ